MVIINQGNKYLNQIITKMKSYLTLLLAAIIFLSILIFIVLIPIIIHPAITTILSNFDGEPVICSIVSYTYKEGISNCSWSSCREGCTNPLIRCHEILVNYSLNYFYNYHTSSQTIQWAYQKAQLFINPMGCGYPPEVQCEQFIKKYSKNFLFPCYYSRTYPEITVVHFSHADSIKNLLLSLTVPNFIAFFSIVILIYFHYPNFSANFLMPLKKSK